MGIISFNSDIFKNSGFDPCISRNVVDFVPGQVKMKHRVTDDIFEKYED